MRAFSFALLFAITCLINLPLSGASAPAHLSDSQAPSSAKVDNKADYSQEAFVIEQFSRKYRFEDDGTSYREDTSRIRIQSEAGVQRYGLLSFSYASASSAFSIDYVRVRKPDGTVVETPPENVQDMPAQITREAPFYSDLHEKQVAVKGLSIGDVLEYRVEEHTTKPLVRGQFWIEYAFSTDAIILDEQLQVSVPGQRQVNTKSTKEKPTVTEDAGKRIYTWHHSSLQHKADENKREQTELAWAQARGRQEQADVKLSSFRTWDDVGRWYGGLQEDRVKPTPDIVAKAAELSQNATDDEAKIKAAYAYVGTKFRYIGIAFGIGRYQPHSAGEVLSNGYGDCKDKHTLLASLLTAMGIPAYPALIDAAREVDPEVPSPGQFDHVITVVPRPGGLLWLDTTTEVGPYGYLSPPLRDKHALVVWKEKPPAFASTPLELPYPTVQNFHMDSALNDEGTLEGHADFSARGDLEALLRVAFRAVPLAQWKDLVQRISYSFGFAGDVSDVTASSPEKTDEPFHMSYKYTRKEFGDWPNRRILAPSPSIALPPADEDLLPKGPIWLGSTFEGEFDAEVKLPGGYKPSPPSAIHLKNSFAEFDAVYEFKGNQLISRRHIKTSGNEVPVERREEYKQFVKVVQDDYGAFISLSETPKYSPGSANQDSTSMGTNLYERLPDSSDEEALRLETEAREDFRNHDMAGAVSSLYRAVGIDPKFARAWSTLGALLILQKQVDAGVDAFHKAIAAAPTEPEIPKTLGRSLMAASRFEEAVPVWQDLLKSYPDDADVSSMLAFCLLRLKRYGEAVTAYEAAAKNHPDRADLQMSLASAYTQAGQPDKAGAAYQALANLKANRTILNNAAYEMANADLQLPLALDFATKAVQEVEEDSQKIGLSDISSRDMGKIFSLAAFWDTLGWVHARNSHLEEAQQYLNASWKLTQDGIVAGHLCNVYERLHKIKSAIQMCRLALNRLSMSRQISLSESASVTEETRARLNHLTGGSADGDAAVDVSDIVIQERRFKLPRFVSGTGNADFLVLFSSDGKGKVFKVEDTKFISGSDLMKYQGKQLKTINFGFIAPGGTPARFVRRGILACYEYTGCEFMLLDPAAAQSVQ